MLERALRYVAIALSAVVALGFILFALDDIGRASEKAEKRVSNSAYQATDPTPAGERERERRHGKTREYIDDANDVLLKPFASVGATSKSRWVQRGAPALLGLLVYGFLVAFLARFMKARGPVIDRRPPASLRGST